MYTIIYEIPINPIPKTIKYPAAFTNTDIKYITDITGFLLVITNTLLNRVAKAKIFKNKLNTNYENNLKNLKIYDRSLKVSGETIKTFYNIHTDSILYNYLNKNKLKNIRLSNDINDKVIFNLKKSQNKFIQNNLVNLNNKLYKNVDITNKYILLKIVSNSLNFFNYQLNDRKILAILFLSQFKFQDFFNNFIKFTKFFYLQRYLSMSTSSLIHNIGYNNYNNNNNYNNEKNISLNYFNLFSLKFYNNFDFLNKSSSFFLNNTLKNSDNNDIFYNKHVINPNVNNRPAETKPCIYSTADTTSDNKAKLVNNGQGD